MCQGIMDFADAGQASVIAPFTLAGAMAPVTMPGALVLQHAEALAGITLAQISRPGAPVIYGSFTSNVDYWKEKNTPAIVGSVADANNLGDGIFQFFETCIDTELFDPRLDLAIREWARRSEVIRAALDDADQIRVQAFTDFFKRFDYPMPQAFIRARVIYFAQIGFYALEVDEPIEIRAAYTEAYFECFTGRSLDPEASRGFQQRIMEKYGDRS